MYVSKNIKPAWTALAQKGRSLPAATETSQSPISGENTRKKKSKEWRKQGVSGRKKRRRDPNRELASVRRKEGRMVSISGAKL